MKGNEKASGVDMLAAELTRQLRSAPVRACMSGLPLFKVDGETPDNLSALLARLSEAEAGVDADGEHHAAKGSGRKHDGRSGTVHHASGEGQSRSN